MGGAMAKFDTAHQIHTSASELAEMARQNDLMLLAYLLEMAALEALDVALDGSVVSRARAKPDSVPAHVMDWVVRR